MISCIILLQSLFFNQLRGCEIGQGDEKKENAKDSMEVR